MLGAYGASQWSALLLPILTMEGGGGGMVQNMQRATYEKWPPSRRPAIEQTRLNTSK